MLIKRESSLILFSLVSTFFGASAIAQPCNKEFLNQLDNNKNLTHFQRLTAAEDRCKGKDIVVVGIVNDVGSARSMNLVGLDGLPYDIHLLTAHQCGDMLRIQKGQKISVRGVITGAYPHLPKFTIENAVCLK